MFNEQKVKRMEAELDIDVKRWNAEINEYIFEKDDTLVLGGQIL